MSDGTFTTSSGNETTYSLEDGWRATYEETEQERDDGTTGGRSGFFTGEGQPSGFPVRKRRVRTHTRWPEGKIVVTALKPNGFPTEKVAMLRMKRLAGLIARQKVPLLTYSVSSLSAATKELLFENCVQNSLEFVGNLRRIAYMKLWQSVGKSFRTFKSDLVRNYVMKGLDATVKHPYITKDDWAAFVEAKSSKEALATSERYKRLREKNKHDHCLGTGGYEAKFEVWEKEDTYLLHNSIKNPWHEFPVNRARHFLRARCSLAVSGNKAAIVWSGEESRSLSEKVLEKTARASSEGTGVRERDMLTEVLGTPEQTGRVRGMSSMAGWKFWPACADMYRKRKSPGALAEAYREEFGPQLDELTAKVAALESGGHGSLPANTPSRVGGVKSSCVREADSDDEPDAAVEILSTSAPCTLAVKTRGYLVEVARGMVYPNQLHLKGQPILEGHSIVSIDHVTPDFEATLLDPPTGEIKALGQAMCKRIQWSRARLTVAFLKLSSFTAPKPPVPTSAASMKVNLKDCMTRSLNGNDSNDQSPSQAAMDGNAATRSHANDGQSALQSASANDVETGSQGKDDQSASQAAGAENAGSGSHDKNVQSASQSAAAENLKRGSTAGRQGPNKHVSGKKHGGPNKNVQ